jgi:hypothetical protein
LSEYSKPVTPTSVAKYALVDPAFSCIDFVIIVFADYGVPFWLAGYMNKRGRWRWEWTETKERGL